MAWRYACGFFQNPEIIFITFSAFLTDIFWVLILQKRIGCRYLVPVTPTTVLSRSFWNFTDALRMVWRYACVFFRILKSFLLLFTHFELRHFLVLILQKSIGNRYLVPLTPPTVFWPILLKLTWVFRMAWRYACAFFQIPEVIFITFSAFWT